MDPINKTKTKPTKTGPALANGEEKKMLRRFDIWIADIPELGDGSHVQQGDRPVVIVSNDMANTYSPIVTVVPLTTKTRKKRLPTHVAVYGYGLHGRNLVLVEQITSIDRSRLQKRVGHIDSERVQQAISDAITVQVSDYHPKKKSKKKQPRA